MISYSINKHQSLLELIDFSYKIKKFHINLLKINLQMAIFQHFMINLKGNLSKGLKLKIVILFNINSFMMGR